MAEQEQVDVAQDDHDDDETPNYKAPAKVSLDELQQKDADDESLVRYKQTLLGKSKAEKPFPDDPRNVIVKKLIFCSEGRDEIELDLTDDLKTISKKVFTLKEGTNYKIKIMFFVQEEIVSGLKYKQKIHRGPVKLDTNVYMVGSYGPKSEVQCFTSPSDELPSGMLARGLYKVKSTFTDDDKNKIFEWEWQMDIKKDWA